MVENGPFPGQAQDRFVEPIGVSAGSSAPNSSIRTVRISTPCPYFHIVFTIPSQLRPIFLRNKRACYDALFRAASETLSTASSKAGQLAQVGAIGVLHTWSQSLLDHPHVHFIVPGGVLTHDNQWIPTSKKFFCSARVLSKLFRGKLLEIIRTLYNSDGLYLGGEIEHLAIPHIFDALMLECASQAFVVYAKRPFAGPKQVVRYLGQYTHRIAISNHRLESIDNDTVTFRVRSKKHLKATTVMKLKKHEFARRFLLHVLPRGFVRIRHFGFLGSRLKAQKIATIRKILATESSEIRPRTASAVMKLPTSTLLTEKCPICGTKLEAIGGVSLETPDSS